MDTGILYVVINEWIRNPETNEKPYKIGITRKSVDDRYYGLGLKMPGKFKTLFAYEFVNCAKAEQLIHGILENKRENGEWFNLNQEDLDRIKGVCELMAGKLITAEIQDDIDVAVNQEPVEPVKVVKKTDAAAKRGKIRRDYKKHRLGFHMRNGKQLTVYKLDNGEDIEVLRDMSDRDWDKGTAALEEYIENRETDGRTARDSLLNGQMDTQKWARKALPILVRQAQKRKTITYGELAKKINSTTPRLGRTLGCIDFAIEELSKDWQRKIPHINALVVNNRGISGSGLPPYDELDDDTLDGKKRFMEKIHDDIFDYPDWIRVQNELLQTNR